MSLAGPVPDTAQGIGYGRPPVAPGRSMGVDLARLLAFGIAARETSGRLSVSASATMNVSGILTRALLTP